MIKNFKLKSTYLYIILVFFVSCKKGDKGDIGPAGPAGANGNSNVLSTTISVGSSDWIISNPTYYVDLSSSILSQDIVNTGTVQVFMASTSSTGVWLNLPWIETYSSYFSTYNFNYSLGKVRVTKYDSDNTQTTNPGAKTFKIVAITAAARVGNPSIDWNNFEEINKVFHLSENTFN